VLDVLQRANNSLNVVVLDACRDNPFGWARSGSRGLSVVGTQPPGSIVVYATGAGSVAQDGVGKNGVFTAELLKNIAVPGLEINEVFHRTGAGVLDATTGKQTPAVYNQFFGRAYLAGAAADASPNTTMYTPRLIGSMLVRAESAGTIYLDGSSVGEIRKGGAKRLSDLDIGYYDLEILYSTGERESKIVVVSDDKETEVEFLWKTFATPTTTTTSSTTITTIYQAPILRGSLLVNTESAGVLYLDGVWKGNLQKGGFLQLTDLEVGYYKLEIKYPSSENDELSIYIDEGKEKVVSFTKIASAQIPKNIVSNEYFTLGSTKDEVIAIQGTPTQFDDQVWTYGYSKIFFTNGRVSS